MKLNQWSNDGENDLADLCRVLSEPFRVRLLRLLGGLGERSVADLCVSAQSCRESIVSQPLVSHHLNLLRTCGLVACRHQARWRYYALAPCVRTESEALVIDVGRVSISITFRPAAASSR